MNIGPRVHDVSLQDVVHLLLKINVAVVWAKFEAMTEGVRLATRQLWG